MADDPKEEANQINDPDRWVPIAHSDPIWNPPEEPPPALADPAPPLLNTHEVPWPSFERLVLRMARDLDDVYDVRRYGNPGQTQHGLDVVGFFMERPPSVYQAKRVQNFGATDLRNAVEKYAEGERPFGANRIVVAVASEASDTATIEELDNLRKKYAELEIELWDRSEISERLRTQPRVVEAFFGRATTEAFCTVEFSMTLPMTGPVSPDAIVRGPVAHLGLLEELRQAEAATDPRDSALGFEAIAERLEASPFFGQSVKLREQQASALEQADLLSEASIVRLRLGWRLLSAGDPFFAQLQVRKIAEHEGRVPDEIVRATNALSAAAGLRHEYAVTLDDLTRAFDEIHDGDPHCAEAALALAEEAIAARRLDVIDERSTRLESLAAAQPESPTGHEMSVRLRMCLADCHGTWDSLTTAARTTYEPHLLAWVMARHARSLALSSLPEMSDARWLDAIERACTESRYDDAANWLYALRAVRVMYWQFEGDPNELHRSAQALRLSGTGTVLPDPAFSRARALAHLNNRKWPDALEALRRFLWRSTMVASWAEELEAHERLGDLFVEIGNAEEAIRHFVFAGQSKKLESLSAKLLDQVIVLPTALLSEAPWERGAAFSAVSALADLLSDDDGAEWVRVAATEVFTLQGSPLRPTSTNPRLAAFKAFGQLSMLATHDLAQEFLQMSAALVDREPNTYKHTDEAHVMALIGIARGHVDLRPAAVEQLAHCVLADQRMADLTLARAGDLLRAERTLVERLLAKQARDGEFNAALGVVISDADPSPIADFAKRRLEIALRPRQHEAGVQHFGTSFPRDGLLISTLEEEDKKRFADAMLEVAADRQEPAQNRQEALDALLPIASTLSETNRDELFESVMAFAQGEHDGSTGDEFFEDSTHPLSRFRFELGPTSLSPSGLQLAAEAARTPAQYNLVERRAVDLLSGADESTSHAIATALSAVPPDQLSLDTALLASHSSQWIRALAAVVWAQRTGGDIALGERLAKDPSPRVRVSLAGSLRNEIVEHGMVRDILLGDPRRSVRWKLRPDA